MRISSDIALAAPVEAVWSIVTDPERVLSYMSGVTRWEVASELPSRTRGALPNAVPGRRR